MTGHRKLVKHFHEPGDCHELTFSCYRQLPLLVDDEWRKMLCLTIDRAIENHHFRLVAFVLMPDHVHLLVLPTTTEVHLDELLFAIKRAISYRIKQRLIESGSPLLEKLTVRERPGKMSFRFWQEGRGYDRNLFTEQIVLNSIGYIHHNPVRRGLVSQPCDWNVTGLFGGSRRWVVKTAA